MGLDMFIERRNKSVEEIIQNEWEEVMYWRKANQIRAWFVRNINGMDEDSDCERFTVTKELLEKLVADCKTVLKKKDKASDILPTSIGFFFGSSEYDEWYFQDLRSTVEGLEKVIEETDWENQEVSYYEWW